jgi:hypothetical protein
MHAARELERVEYTAELIDPRDRFELQAPELLVEECNIERGVVDDQLSTGNELAQLVRNVGEARLALQKLRRDAVDLQRAGIDLPVRAQVPVQPPTGAPPVDDLDAADLDNAVTETRLEPGRFGIEDDLTHHPVRALRTAVTTCCCCSGVTYGCIGRLITRRAAASDTGKLPTLCASPANTGCRCSGTG